MNVKSKKPVVKANQQASAKKAAPAKAITVSPVIEEYKNSKILVLNPDVENPYHKVSFGLNKARHILAAIPAIKKFVESNGAEC